ncbi:MAG: preprotein translocase subunit SecE [Prochlorococcus sp. SP3034]|nr:preprotein translocase subunit SecE [Prochlorococcus sp. SP3034]
MTIPTTDQEPQKDSSSNIEDTKKKKNFFVSTYDELKLVVWPNKQQLFSESVAVIIMVSFSAAVIAAVSRFYGWAASQIFQLN